MGKKKRLKTAFDKLMKGASLYHDANYESDIGLDIPEMRLDDAAACSIDALKHHLLVRGVFMSYVTRTISRHTAKEVLMSIEDKNYMASVIDDTTRDVFNAIIPYVCERFVISIDTACNFAHTDIEEKIGKFIEFILWVCDDDSDKRNRWIGALSNRNVAITFIKTGELPCIFMAGYYRPSKYDVRVRFLGEKNQCDVTLKFIEHSEGEWKFIQESSVKEAEAALDEAMSSVLSDDTAEQPKEE